MQQRGSPTEVRQDEGTSEMLAHAGRARNCSQPGDDLTGARPRVTRTDGERGVIRLETQPQVLNHSALASNPNLPFGGVLL